MGLKDKLGEHVGVVVIDMTQDYLEDYSRAYSKSEFQILRFLRKDAKRMIKLQERIIIQCAHEDVPLYFVVTTEELTGKCK